MAIVTVGIDLAKNVFAVHGVKQAKLYRCAPRYTRQTTRTHRWFAALSDWHGSLFWCGQLDQGVCQIWLHGANDGAKVCGAIKNYQLITAGIVYALTRRMPFSDSDMQLPKIGRT